jgi:ATP-dependent Clp protease adaptor protein ClpS
MPELTPAGQPGGDDVAVLDEPVVRTGRQRRTDDKKSPKKPRRQPPYAVIVHDDDYHTYEYVIECLQRVCGHPLEKAFELTKQIDQTGRAAVWSGPKEVAELKRDQIRGFGPDFHASVTVKFPLGVTIEPLPGE